MGKKLYRMICGTYIAYALMFSIDDSTIVDPL